MAGCDKGFELRHALCRFIESSLRISAASIYLRCCKMVNFVLASREREERDRGIDHEASTLAD